MMNNKLIQNRVIVSSVLTNIGINSLEDRSRNTIQDISTIVFIRNTNKEGFDKFITKYRYFKPFHCSDCLEP